MDLRPLTLLLVRNAVRYRTELTEPQIEVYIEDLQRYDEPTLVAAFAWCAREGGRFFPTVPELENAIASMGRASGAVLDGASAWAAFEYRVLSRYSFGVTRVIDWPDGLTRTIVREQLGLGATALHNLALLEGEFERERYRRMFIKLYNDQRGLSEARRAVTAAEGILRLGDGD